MKNRVRAKINLLYIFFHPFFLTLFFWLLLIYFVPNYFNKYNAKVIETRAVRETSKIYYHDMDNDGSTEQLVSIYNKGEFFPAITYYNNNNTIIDQWNLVGKWLNRQKYFFGDFDNNGFEEVYCITRVNDSLFLNAKELLNKNGLEIKSRFITKAHFFNNNQIDSHIIDGKLMDVNKDGIGEFVFTLWSGLSNYPRNSFAYYINSDSLISSPTSASTFSRGLNYMDCNNDGVEEITGFIAGTNNISDTILPYTDSTSWLMVMDPAKNFDFIFPPVKNNEVFSIVSSVFCKLYNEKYLMTFSYSNSPDRENDGLSLKLYDTKGSLVKSKIVENLDYLSIIPNSMENNIYLVSRNGNIFTTDTSLILKKHSSLMDDDIKLGLYTNISYDIDDDGEAEHIFLSNRSGIENLLIYRSNLKEPTFVELPASRLSAHWVLTMKKDDQNSEPIIVLQADNNVYYIEYTKSRYYLLKYPAYIIAFILLYLLFWIMQKGQNLLAQRKFEMEKKLMRQQMALSKRQLEPHFMLNTLNNIGYMFSKENKDDAQYFFGRFSSLIHRGLLYADQVETSLNEELEFVRDYLILQKQRFDGDLEIAIEADFGIDLSEIKIPHSLVFTFVENAVKHGLRHKTSDRSLSIYIRKVGSQIEIAITDNGIGRKQSKVLKTSGTGKGMNIIANIIEGYNKLNNSSISYTVVDLLDNNGDNKGTMVNIKV